MAIIKLPSGKFQVKVRGEDRQWITRAFDARKDAWIFESTIKKKLHEGTQITSEVRSMTLDQYFEKWFETVQTRASQGWRKEQVRNYRVFIRPILGEKRLQAVNPQNVAKVLNEMVRQGKSEQTQLHIFNLLRKMFGDAIEMFRLLTYNPAQKALKPKVPMKDSPHLNLSQVKSLLQYVQGKPYGDAIWLQIYLGLRIGELQALCWKDVDLERGIVHIRRTCVRKENCIRDYPKGRRQHVQKIPHELLQLLVGRKIESPDEFVVTAAQGGMLRYEWYFRTLRRYCKQLGINSVGTHGLRHSTSELYLSHGASRDDIRELFAHSSNSVTDRYIHYRGSNLEKVADVINLFPKCSTVPWKEIENGTKKEHAI